MIYKNGIYSKKDSKTLLRLTADSSNEPKGCTINTIMRN